ncbi:restriction endonuclease [Crateriforma conspicua]|uniref:restriction endonuclease n=1 Tax=Crateriforma conspicua TaxID=2527996 RepID=UPI00118BE2E9|nr:restriction endonuclease [Crateriforma conspicua]QDV66082.1 Mrr restriction system protein [Crateriforma conspicua]
MLPLLQAIADGDEHRLRSLYDQLADVFSLTEDERSQLLPSGQQRLFHNRIGWARTYLKKAGLLDSPKRGFVKITGRGSEILDQEPERIDSALLNRFEEFREFTTQTREQGKTDSESPDVPQKSTPEESIDSAYAEIITQLTGELLETLRNSDPFFFEKVVVKLLRGMGYGGVRGRGVVTPRSGDGGIDGIIYEDKLGLDTVCIQAKRWANVVGRKTVQEFVGSMDLHRSRKGVIITTSHFSPDAQDYVDRIEGKKVVLIDGEELARLMIDHRIGVSVSRSYDIVELSQDFFDETD